MAQTIKFIVLWVTVYQTTWCHIPEDCDFKYLCITVVITGPLSRCNQTGKNPAIVIC